MLIQRKAYEQKIADAYRLVPIVVLIGARQVGKTSIMRMFPKDGFRSTLFLNGQNVETAELFLKFSRIEQYLRISMGEQLEGLLLIDEFQFIDGVSTILKLLTDKYEGLRILCSGSSSMDIQQKVEESLAGRVRIIEVLSLSFSEYLLFRNETLYVQQKQITEYGDESLSAGLQSAYQEYLIYGGLPRAALTDNPEEKAEVLNDIYQTYLMNDVRRYIANEHFVGFNKLLRLLAAQTGNLVNINDLSRESGLPYGTCEEYIFLLQKMYIIKLIEPYFTNKRKVIGKMKKVYFCDLGFRNVIYNSFSAMPYRTDNGAIFENEILLALWRLRKATETINFYRTQNGSEVDFVLTGPTRRLAVECKYKRYDKPISVASLDNFSAEEGMDRRYVVNMNLYGAKGDALFVPGIFSDRLIQ